MSSECPRTDSTPPNSAPPPVPPNNGALIYFEDQRTPPSPDSLGQIVVVETKTDEVLVKLILLGQKLGRFDLVSLEGPTRKDCEIRWAPHITAIIPPYQARRIICSQPA